MTHSRFYFLMLLTFFPLLCSCSQLGWKVSVVSVDAEKSAPSSITDQERRFAGALVFLQSGNEQSARDLLELVIDGPTRNGVTDEALFRLSVLSLRDEGAKGNVRALELLERLKTEFPSSIWTRQAAPLSVYLTGIRTLRDRQREVKSLKELNYSLSRDNREMRQSIERLKSLDLELEQKIKR